MTMVEVKAWSVVIDTTLTLAKSGYINLLQRPVKTQYDRELLAARKLVANSGFYATALSGQRSTAGTDRPITQSPMAILDAGCGEGSHLSVLITRLRREMEISPIGVGVDLAREANSDGGQKRPGSDPGVWRI